MLPHDTQGSAPYAVDAVSVTDAEVKVFGEFDGSNLEFEVTAVVETKIVKVI